MIYFDNAANKKVDEFTTEKLTDYLLKFGGNAESRHSYANNFRNLLKEKEKNLFAEINLNSYEGLYFNSGTEIFNFIRFFIKEKAGNCNIVTSKIEHPSVLANLQNSKAEIRYLKINETHQFDIESLSEIINDKTFMTVLNFIQSETGLIQNLDTIIAKIRKINPNTLILIDAIQGFNKHPLPADADFYAVSNHKICGLAGAVLISRKYLNVNLHALQNKFRHEQYLQGRIEIPQLLCMYDYLQENYLKQAENLEKIRTLNNFIRTKITNDFCGKCYCKFSQEETTPYILQIIFPNYDGAVLAGLLAEEDIMVSSGSACLAESKTPSKALKELNFSKQELFSTLRLSFSPSNTIQEAELFIEKLAEIIKNY